jgi:hypothetical protein
MAAACGHFFCREMAFKRRARGGGYHIVIANP